MQATKQATVNLEWALTLEWDNAGKKEIGYFDHKKRKKNKQNKPTISIGRDDELCDVVLSNLTVSDKHVEIFFEPLHQRFFIKNSQTRNVCVVNGVPLVGNNKLPLSQGNIIHLGEEQQELKISTVYIPGSKIFEATILPSTSKLIQGVNQSQNTNEINPNSNTNGVNSNLNSSEINQSLNTNRVNSNPNTSGINSERNSNNESKSGSKDIPIAVMGLIGTIIVAGITGIVTLAGNYINQNIERNKIEFEKNKVNIQLRYDKEKLYEDRLYLHKDKILNLLKEKTEYKKIILRNECDEPIYIATSFIALDDVSETRGWNTIPKNGEIEDPGYFTKNAGIFLYAITSRSRLVWQGQGDGHIEKFVISKQFNYIADTFFETNKKLVKFYLVPVDSKNGSITKTFRCDSKTLQ